MPSRKLSKVSSKDLRRELDRRAGQINKLQSEREALLSKLSDIDGELEALTGSVTPRKGRSKKRKSKGRKRGSGGSAAARTRARNSMTLAQALQKALSGKTMGVSEAADAVQKAGYKTNANEFPTIVNLTLLKRKDLFKKKGRGQYTAA